MNWTSFISFCALVGAGLLAGTASAENLLRDDFLDDNYGGFVDWTAVGKAQPVRLAEKGPDGGAAIRVDRGRFEHVQLMLVGDEEFALSVWVRTKGQKNPKLVFGDSRESLGKVELPIPDDTKGEWKKIEWRGKSPKAFQNYYIVRFLVNTAGKGYLDVSSPVLEPLSDKAKAASHPRSANAPFVARITPIDPEVNALDPRAATMLFHFSGPVSDGAERFELVAEMAGRTFAAKFDERKRARISFGTIHAGSYRVLLTVRGERTRRTVATNEYVFSTARISSEATPLTKLNNFVSEIFTKPLADGEYAFSFATPGWLYLGLDRPQAGVTAELDGAEVLRNAGTRHMETMRHVEAGRHTVRVKGVAPGATGELRFRRVKLITGSPKWQWNDADAARIRRWGVDTCYNFSCYGGTDPKVFDPASRISAALRGDLARGIRVTYGSPCFWERAAVRNYPDVYEDICFDNLAGRRGLPVVFEENTVRASRLMKYNAANLWWKANAVGRHLDIYYADLGRMSFFDDPDFDIPEMSAYANGGDGTGVMIHEAYYSAPGTREGLDGVYGEMKRQIAQMRELVPIYPRHLVALLNTYLSVGSWTSWPSPESDYKGFISRYLQLMATDPEFADLGGVGVAGGGCEEDCQRFIWDAVRHYCIEGATDDFAAACGIRELPGHMANGDFGEDFAGWTVEPAAADSIRTGKNGRLAGFMRRWGNRFTGPFDRGTFFATMTKQASGTNRLTRTLTGLRKGACYHLHFASWNPADFDEQKAPAKADAKKLVGLSLAGGTLIPECFSVSYKGDARFTKFRIASHEYVFRAEGETATFTLSDGEALRPGETRAVNYVGVHPYYRWEPASETAR